MTKIKDLKATVQSLRENFNPEVLISLYNQIEDLGEDPCNSLGLFGNFLNDSNESLFSKFDTCSEYYPRIGQVFHVAKNRIKDLTFALKEIYNV